MKSLAKVIEEVLDGEQENDQIKNVDLSIIDDYKKLNDKCDVVIGKINNRKGKKTIKKTEE